MQSKPLRYKAVVCLAVLLTSSAAVFADNYEATLDNRCPDKNIIYFALTVEGGETLSNAQGPAGWQAVINGNVIVYDGGQIAPGATQGGFLFSASQEPTGFSEDIRFDNGQRANAHPSHGATSLSAQAAGPYIIADCPTSSAVPLTGPTGLVLLAVGILLVGYLTIRRMRTSKT